MPTISHHKALHAIDQERPLDVYQDPTTADQGINSANNKTLPEKLRKLRLDGTANGPGKAGWPNEIDVEECLYGSGEDGISKGAYTRVGERDYHGCLPKQEQEKGECCSKGAPREDEIGKRGL